MQAPQPQRFEQGPPQHMQGPPQHMQGPPQHMQPQHGFEQAPPQPQRFEPLRASPQQQVFRAPQAECGAPQQVMQEQFISKEEVVPMPNEIMPPAAPPCEYIVEEIRPVLKTERVQY